MVGLQASIGALNDLLDAPLDAGRKTGKPIPRGLATQREAGLLTVGGLVIGLVLVAPSGWVTIGIALVGVAWGYLYDVRLSRGLWSWLPLAVALPLVPIYAWAGATSTVPSIVVLLIPVGLLAGAGLSIANGLADLERDASADAQTVAVRLGRVRAWNVSAALLVGAICLAALILVTVTVPGRRPGIGLAMAGMVVGAFSILAGLALGRSGGALVRERAWELEAFGVAILGAGWIASAA